MKKGIAAIGLTAALAITAANGIRAEPMCYVGDHDLVESYIESDNAPELFKTTAYYHGSITASGRTVREGMAAGAKQWLGMCAIVYEAIPDRNGGYKVGDLIGFYELSDVGYGKSSGDGVRSTIRPDKASRGTIERGECLDVYRSSYARAKDWMERTNGKCFAQIICAKG